MADESATRAARTVRPGARRWATSWWGTLCLAGVAGGVLAFAFPPYDIWLLAPLSLAALFVLVDLGTRHSQTRRAAVTGAGAGAVFGLVFFGLLAPWLRVIGPDAYVLVVLASLVFTSVFGAGAALLVRLPGWPVWLACWWVAVEGLRSRIPFGGFPWGRVGHSQVDAPTAAWVSVGGVPLLGFVVVLVASMAAWAILAAARRQAVGAAVVGLACCVLFMSALVLPTPVDGRDVTVAVVQGNVPATGMDAFGRGEAVLNAHLEATHQLAEDVRSGEAQAPDFVIWPENASDIDPSLDAGAFTSISDAVADIGVPVLVGLVVEVDGGERVANQGTVWDPVTGPGQTYVKQNLVPFGEYVPLRDALEPIISRLDRIPRDFVAGSEPGVLRVGPTVVADAICFDVAYDATIRDAVAGGGEVITVQTNNATYGHTGQVEQQWAMSRLRAIEHGRSVIVASTSGISGVISPDGSVIARAPEFEQTVLDEVVTARTDETLATRVGVWPEIVISGIGICALLVAAASASRRRRRGRIEA